MWSRLIALIVKEFLALLRDPRSRALLIGPPIMQLIVFSYAATLEVKNVDIAVFSQDSGAWGQELVRRIEGAPSFRKVTVLASQSEIPPVIDRQASIAAIVIGADFSRNIEAGIPAEAQIILDGRRSNASQIVAGYIGQIVGQLSADAGTPHGPGVDVIPRNWFNPNLIYQWTMVPSLIGSIALSTGLILTALSIARERELGTFDQLMVSPLRTHEILIGKVVPPLVIGLVLITVYIAAAVLVFGVPLRGSVILLYVGGASFLAAVIGVGLFISALSMTQQQAILGAFVFIVPATLLSGFATPINSMPEWLQPVTLANPLRYYLAIVKGIFLRDVGPAEVLNNTLPMIAIAIATLGGAAWLFRRRME